VTVTETFGTETFGALLRRLRLAAGFDTPAAVCAALAARGCGVAEWTYARWESDRNRPQREHLVTLIEVLGPEGEAVRRLKELYAELPTGPQAGEAA
jgi:transcriptional regulator with XRE-family HTH domain